MVSTNSRQNGLLLRVDIHIDLDDYLVSVDSDDDYKTIVFGLDGRSLGFIYANHSLPTCVSLDHVGLRG